MRIGYCKVGRSMPLTLEKCGSVGGDIDVIAILHQLATRRPNDEFILVGKNSGERPRDVGFPDNVTNPWIRWGSEWKTFARTLTRDGNRLSEDSVRRVNEWYDTYTFPTFKGLDALIVWDGQHGTSNTPIPKVGGGWDDVTRPLDSFTLYASYIVRGINGFRFSDPLRREEIHIIADARNYLKMRDLKWPLRNPVLGQFTFEHEAKYERYTDLSNPDVLGFPEARWEGSHVWIHPVRYIYAGVERCALVPGTPYASLMNYSEEWDTRKRFGLFINEARAYVNSDIARKTVMQEYVLPLQPDWVHGKWTATSLRELGINIEPAPWSEYYTTLQSVKCTFTTPSSGSGWTTLKPWEAFGCGTVCFFHPAYDTQNNALEGADPSLIAWLRVENPEQLRVRVDAVCNDENLWRWLIRAQREHYDRSMERLPYLDIINDRLDAS